MRGVRPIFLRATYAPEWINAYAQANGLPQASPGQARNERRPGSAINRMRKP